MANLARIKTVRRVGAAVVVLLVAAAIYLYFLPPNLQLWEPFERGTSGPVEEPFTDDSAIPVGPVDLEGGAVGSGSGTPEEDGDWPMDGEESSQPETSEVALDGASAGGAGDAHPESMPEPPTAAGAVSGNGAQESVEPNASTSASAGNASGAEREPVLQETPEPGVDGGSGDDADGAGPEPGEGLTTDDGAMPEDPEEESVEADAGTRVDDIATSVEGRAPTMPETPETAPGDASSEGTDDAGSVPVPDPSIKGGAMPEDPKEGPVEPDAGAPADDREGSTVLEAAEPGVDGRSGEAAGGVGPEPEVSLGTDGGVLPEDSEDESVKQDAGTQVDGSVASVEERAATVPETPETALGGASLEGPDDAGSVPVPEFFTEGGAMPEDPAKEPVESDAGVSADDGEGSTVLEASAPGVDGRSGDAAGDVGPKPEESLGTDDGVFPEDPEEVPVEPDAGTRVDDGSVSVQGRASTVPKMLEATLGGAPSESTDGAVSVPVPDPSTEGGAMPEDPAKEPVEPDAGAPADDGEGSTVLEASAPGVDGRSGDAVGGVGPEPGEGLITDDGAMLDEISGKSVKPDTGILMDNRDMSVGGEKLGVREVPVLAAEDPSAERHPAPGTGPSDIDNVIPDDVAGQSVEPNAGGLAGDVDVSVDRKEPAMPEASEPAVESASGNGRSEVEVKPSADDDAVSEGAEEEPAEPDILKQAENRRVSMASGDVDPSRSVRTGDGSGSALDDGGKSVPPPLSAPEFSIVRVDTSGATLVAGKAYPQSEITVLLDEFPIHMMSADSETGEFATLLTLDPSDHPRLMALEARHGGQVARSNAEVVIIPRVRIADAEQGAESRDTGEVPREQPPVAVIVTDEGVRELPGPESGSSSDMPLRINTVSYLSAGEVALAGAANPGNIVRLYVNNALAESVTVRSAGSWSARLSEIVSDEYNLRLDEIGGNGEVVNRWEATLRRPMPDVVARTQSTQPETGNARLREVIIKSGDTLWAISRKRYGKGILYFKVFEANREQIRDPDLIYPGQIFELPD